MKNALKPGQRLKLFHPNKPDLVEFGTFKEYEGEAMIVQFDTLKRSCQLGDWECEVIPGEIVSHYQVWECKTQHLAKDNIPNPTAAKAWIKNQEEKEREVASRREDYLPPRKYEIRSVPA